ncbi:MAG TPA: hypothetical protein VHY33_09360 [Thermoanaerobaculia bacterium]|jgi:HEAT repeat protein|nr:hypothetical protein [Thermoanaerobaculia bacterium]
MAKTGLMLLLAFSATTALADDTPASIALLVNEANAEAVASRIGPALEAKDSLTRAAATRVALVRGVTAVVPRLRTLLTTETDPDAAREEVRAHGRRNERNRHPEFRDHTKKVAFDPVPVDVEFNLTANFLVGR